MPNWHWGFGEVKGVCPESENVAPRTGKFGNLPIVCTHTQAMDKMRYGGNTVAPSGNQMSNGENRHSPVALGILSLLDK